MALDKKELLFYLMQIRKVGKQHLKPAVLRYCYINARLSTDSRAEVCLKKIIECEVIRMAHGNSLNSGNVMENPLVWGNT